MQSDPSNGAVCYLQIGELSTAELIGVDITTRLRLADENIER
jgi:hypothetical protein